MSDESIIPEKSLKRVRKNIESQEGAKKIRAESQIVFKMLCPYWAAPAVIGTKGAGLKQITEDTECMIKLSKNHENFPMTNERVVSIRGLIYKIKRAICQVQNKIRNDEPPPNAPYRDNSHRKNCLKLVVSVSSAGRVIGKGGSKTKELQANHDVHISVMRTTEMVPGLKESVMTLTGDKSNVDRCAWDIIDLVSEDVRADLDFDLDYSLFNQYKLYP